MTWQPLPGVPGYEHDPTTGDVRPVPDNPVDWLRSQLDSMNTFTFEQTEETP